MSNNIGRKKDEIMFMISSIGIIIIVVDFLRRLFFISVPPWTTHLPVTSLDDASPVWLSAIFTFIYISLFLAKKITKPFISFLIWLSCGIVISIPTEDIPFYFFLLLILICSLYLSIRDLQNQR